MSSAGPDEHGLRDREGSRGYQGIRPGVPLPWRGECADAQVSALQHRAALRAGRLGPRPHSTISTGTARAIEGTTDFAPIFVTGMPRSGTTLIEQIIASHSTVTGGGEIGECARAAQLLTRRAERTRARLHPATADQSPGSATIRGVYPRRVPRRGTDHRQVDPDLHVPGPGQARLAERPVRHRPPRSARQSPVDLQEQVSRRHPSLCLRPARPRRVLRAPSST